MGRPTYSPCSEALPTCACTPLIFHCGASRPIHSFAALCHCRPTYAPLWGADLPIYTSRGATDLPTHSFGALTYLHTRWGRRPTVGWVRMTYLHTRWGRRPTVGWVRMTYLHTRWGRRPTVGWVRMTYLHTRWGRRPTVGWVRMTYLHTRWGRRPTVGWVRMTYLHTRWGRRPTVGWVRMTYLHTRRGRRPTVGWVRMAAALHTPPDLCLRAATRSRGRTQTDRSRRMRRVPPHRWRGNHGAARAMSCKATLYRETVLEGDLAL